MDGSKFIVHIYITVYKTLKKVFTNPYPEGRAHLVVPFGGVSRLWVAQCAHRMLDAVLDECLRHALAVVIRGAQRLSVLPEIGAQEDLRHQSQHRSVCCGKGGVPPQYHTVGAEEERELDE